MGALIIQISVAVIAIAVVVLVYYLVQTLKSAKSSMEQVNITLAAVQQQLEETGKESNILLRNTQLITEDVQHKLAATDKIFSSVQHIGEAVQEVSNSVKQVSATVTRSMHGVGNSVNKNQSKIQNVVELATSGYHLFNSLKTRKKQDHSLNKGDES